MFRFTQRMQRRRLLLGEEEKKAKAGGRGDIDELLQKAAEEALERDEGLMSMRERLAAQRQKRLTDTKTNRDMTWAKGEWARIRKLARDEVIRHARQSAGLELKPEVVEKMFVLHIAKELKGREREKLKPKDLKEVLENALRKTINWETKKE